MVGTAGFYLALGRIALEGPALSLYAVLVSHSEFTAHQDQHSTG
jgi:hypothetical protein